MLHEANNSQNGKQMGMGRALIKFYGITPVMGTKLSIFWEHRHVWRVRASILRLDATQFWGHSPDWIRNTHDAPHTYTHIHTQHATHNSSQSQTNIPERQRLIELPTWSGHHPSVTAGTTSYISGLAGAKRRLITSISHRQGTLRNKARHQRADRLTPNPSGLIRTRRPPGCCDMGLSISLSHQYYSSRNRPHAVCVSTGTLPPKRLQGRDAKVPLSQHEVV